MIADTSRQGSGDGSTDKAVGAEFSGFGPDRRVRQGKSEFPDGAGAARRMTRGNYLLLDRVS